MAEILATPSAATEEMAAAAAHHEPPHLDDPGALLRERVAARTAVYGPSIWTNILTLFERHPDPVYFGDGAPSPEEMPVAKLREASQKAWQTAPASLGYGESAGFQPLRELIAARMKPRGIEADPGEIIVTAGSTQGIELACKVMLDPGDVVLVENPTFLGALETFGAYEPRFATVPLDEYGMDVEALARILIAEPRAKIIYTIPTFQNPTGSTMPLARRERLIEIARQHNVLLVEDDPYGELQYDGEPVPPLRALAPEVLYLGTFSKTIAPAIRTGWTVAPPALFPLLLGAREAIDVHNDRIAMRTVYHTAADGLDEHLVGARARYQRQRDALLAALMAHMPEGVTWSRPAGGFFIWVTLPEHVDVMRLSALAADHGVIFFPGHWFYPNRERRNVLRLSFSTVPEPRIHEGIARLAAALAAYPPE
jgi:2-aminoadipate transaminase